MESRAITNNAHAAEGRRPKSSARVDKSAPNNARPRPQWLQTSSVSIVYENRDENDIMVERRPRKENKIHWVVR
jgi:hypothetical protein